VTPGHRERPACALRKRGLRDGHRVAVELVLPTSTRGAACGGTRPPGPRPWPWSAQRLAGGARGAQSWSQHEAHPSVPRPGPEVRAGTGTPAQHRTWDDAVVKENKFQSVLDANLSADLVLILLFISEAQLKIHKLRKLTDGASGIFVSYLNL